MNTKGVWTRDLRYQSNVDLKELNKILKMMEGKKMIKAVNSVVVRLNFFPYPSA